MVLAPDPPDGDAVVPSAFGVPIPVPPCPPPPVLAEPPPALPAPAPPPVPAPPPPPPAPAPPPAPPPAPCAYAAPERPKTSTIVKIFFIETCIADSFLSRRLNASDARRMSLVAIAVPGMCRTPDRPPSHLPTRRGPPRCMYRMAFSAADASLTVASGNRRPPKVPVHVTGSNRATSANSPALTDASTRPPKPQFPT